MFRKEITLAEGDKLLLEWEGNYQNLCMVHEQQVVAQFPDVEVLKAGKVVGLPRGRPLTVVLRDDGLEIWQNGLEMMTGLKSGEVDKFARAVNWLIGVGAFWFMWNLFFAVPSIWILGVWRLLYMAVLSGGLFVGLGFWAKKRQVTLPLWIGFGLAPLYILLFRGLFGLVIFGLTAYYLYHGAKTGPLNKPDRLKGQGEGGPLDANL